MSFSADKLSTLGELSPAFLRYQGILEKTPTSFSEKIRHQRLSSWCDLVADIFLDNQRPEIICRQWSSIADNIIQETWKHHGLDKKSLACFALGKLGSQELNLSSDIDLIIVSENPCPKETELKIRSFTKDITEVTDFGFCFRVDYDLRPGGRFSPLIPSFSRAEDHYWTQGQTWERLALVRARPICGEPNLVSQVADLFQSFTYRKYINYSLFEDLKSLRSDIFQFRPLEKPDLLHLKLMNGGIRDIELFVHALQVIHGGRVLSVRPTSTSAAIDSLIESQCGDADDLRFLKDLYWGLRDAENRAQAAEDTQTHSMKKDYSPELYSRLRKDADRASNIVSEILGAEQKSAALPHSDEEQKSWLTKLGFNENSVQQQWPALIKLTARSSRYAHDEQARQRVLKLFIERLAKGIDPDLGLSYLYDFIKSVRAKSSFFSLFIHEQKLVDDLANLFSTSPTLSQIFVNRPELLDSFVFNISESTSSDPQEALEELFEKKLLADVRYSMEFLATLRVEGLTRSLSNLADQVFNDLLNQLKKECPSSVEVLKMGKWAGSELGLKSDLDLVLVSPDKVTDLDYKLARRLISRVTENHRGGHFYQIDLRLRPTGNAGPLILSESQLLDYLKKKAEPWEKQSYLRSRFSGDLDHKIHEILLNTPFNNNELSTLKDIRQKLYKNSSEHIDLKFQPGGLLDIEFAAQIAVIQQGASIKSPRTVDLLEAAGANDLAQSYQQLRQLEQSLHLLTQRGASLMENRGNELLRLSRVLNKEPDELYKSTLEKLKHNSERLKDLDPIWSTD